jgi:magnesium transporter
MSIVATVHSYTEIKADESGKGWYSRNMLFRYTYHGGVWVDLEHPTEDEIRAVTKEFGVSERLEAELFSPTPSPLVAGDSAVAFLALHFPTPGADSGDIRDQEIDVIVGHAFIITVRYEVVEPIHRLQKLLKTEQLISPKDTMTTDVLLEILFAHLYTSMRDHTNYAASNLVGVEREMYSGQERKAVRSISDISRVLLHMEAVLTNQEDALKRYLEALTHHGFFGPSFAERSLRILAERAQIARLVKTHRAIATELREANVALLGARQNGIMKMLTIITVIVFPLELIAVTLGMHLPGTPLEGNPYGFIIVIGIMLLIAVLMTLFFIKKRWLF